MYEQLKSVLADVFGCDPKEIPDDAELTALASWDSLHHLELMLALEDEFEVHIQAEEIPELVSLERISDYMRERCPG